MFFYPLAYCRVIKNAPTAHLKRIVGREGGGIERPPLAGRE